MRLRVLRQCAAIILLVVDAEIVSVSGGHKSERQPGCSSEFQFAEPSLSGGREAHLPPESYKPGSLEDDQLPGASRWRGEERLCWEIRARVCLVRSDQGHRCGQSSPAAACFPQILSLEPNYRPSVPGSQPGKPACRTNLKLADQLRPYAGSSSRSAHPCCRSFLFQAWHPSFEDSLDFEVTLTDMNLRDPIVTLVARHVPPPSQKSSRLRIGCARR
jgi:hypothetical protein